MLPPIIHEISWINIERRQLRWCRIYYSLQYGFRHSIQLGQITTVIIVMVFKHVCSRELFADYWTALESRVRRDDDCDRVYSGVMPHPLIDLQYHKTDQITTFYNQELVTDAMITADPIRSAETLIAPLYSQQPQGVFSRP